MQPLIKKIVTLAGFLALVLGGGILIGISTPPNVWFAALEKPAFNPPGWIFGPVWTVLYVFIAIAGWRQWLRRDEGGALKIWGVQLFLNFLWSPTFFGAQRIDLALAVIVALLISILLFIRATWARDRVSSILFLPYAAWVGFATLLNVSILMLNP